MKKILISLLSVFTVLIFISCGSKPAPEKTEPEAPKVEDSTENSKENLSEYERLMDEIKNARKAAVEAGAEENASNQLKFIDDMMNALDKDDPDFSNKAKDIVGKYNLLANYSNAVALKKEIDENDFAGYAKSNYDNGVEYLEKVEAAFKSSGLNDKKTETYAKEAYSNLNTVILVAYKKLAKEERVLAIDAKKKADSVKVGVARKSEYKETVETLQKGDSLYSMQSPKKALECYSKAKDSFNSLYADVFAKRAAAQAAIDAAKKRVEESQKFAEEADMKAPITDENVDGLESDDAVLLEEDKYAAPEESEVKIPDTIDDAEGGE